MTHTQQNIAAIIRRRGHRMTPQRQLILDAVCEGGGHSTVDEIYKRVHSRTPAINRSTVYRTLEFLQAVRLVVAADIDGSHVYEIAHEHPHHHLHCRRCGCDHEIGQDIMAPVLVRVLYDYAFRIDADHLVLNGLCRDCVQNADGREQSGASVVHEAPADSAPRR